MYQLFRFKIQRWLTYELIFLIILSSICSLKSKHHVRYFHNHDKHRHFATHFSLHHKNSLNYLINPSDTVSHHHHYKSLGLKNNNQHTHKNKLNSIKIDKLTTSSQPFIEPKSFTSSLKSADLSSTTNKLMDNKSNLKIIKSIDNLTNTLDDNLLLSTTNLNENYLKLNNTTTYSSLFNQPKTIPKTFTKNNKRFAYTSIMLNDDNKVTQCKVTTTMQKRLCANCESMSNLNESSSNNKKLIKIAVLAPNSDNLPYSLNKILPSILHAVNIIENGAFITTQSDNQTFEHNFKHLTSKYQFRVFYRDTNCSSSIGPLAAFDFFIEGSVDVFFGPLCDYVLAPVTRYSSMWNIPVLTTAGQNDNFDQKGIYYRLLTRMNGSYSQMGSLLVQILRKFEWTVIGMLFHNNLSPISKTMGHSSCYFKLGAIFAKLNSSSNHYHTSFDETDPKTDYVELLTTAAKNARIIVMCAQSADTIRKIMLTASDLGYTQKGDFVFFSIELLTNNKINMSMPWYRENDKENNEKARAAYQALLIVTSKEPEYKEFEKFFTSISEIAKRRFNYNYIKEEVNTYVISFYETMMVYAHVLDELIKKDQAFTNYNNGTLITQSIWNRTFQGLTGKISIDDTGDRSTDFSLLSMDQRTGNYNVVANYFGSEEKFVDVDNQKIQWPGNRLTPPPAIPVCGFDGSKCKREEIFYFFTGACLFIFVLLIFGCYIHRHLKMEAELNAMQWKIKWEDILQGNQDGVGTGRKLSIASLGRHSIAGLAYLHGSEVKVHGNLKSSNCVVDSRFILKITDFGLFELRENDDLEQQNDNSYQYWRSKLWTAPEILRDSKLKWGTQKGDVYAFSIIMHEIIFRQGPFYLGENVELSPEEIVEKVKNTTTKPYFRPKIEMDQDVDEAVLNVMQKCWSEDPNDRSDSHSLKSTIKKFNKDLESDNFLDNLLKRNLQYATNLEGLVDERTALYLEEKNHAEQLLYQLIPKSVASQLIQGQKVVAESYESVTIYFSDIVGFTTICSNADPMQVVDLLNDLYTCFDSITNRFDCYKVETIGDAYFVVSGLPNRNGDSHAREVARLSLTLLNAVYTFKIRHLPNKQLKLRIGIHSGSCVAGVIGIKMPRYCLFGDTVNTASRMESTGEALKIHISNVTYELLQKFNTFEMVPRGEIDVKGKGKMKTFWLFGDKSDNLQVPFPPRIQD